MKAATAEPPLKESSGSMMIQYVKKPASPVISICTRVTIVPITWIYEAGTC
jgi:hypothetical protein